MAGKKLQGMSVKYFMCISWAFCKTFLHAPAVVSNSSSSHNHDGASGKWQVASGKWRCGKWLGGLPLNNPPNRAAKKKKKRTFTFRAVKCYAGA